MSCLKMRINSTLIYENCVSGLCLICILECNKMTTFYSFVILFTLIVLAHAQNILKIPPETIQLRNIIENEPRTIKLPDIEDDIIHLPLPITENKTGSEKAVHFYLFTA